MLVVEARDRIGGRMHTVRIPVDLGAAWIHGTKGTRNEHVQPNDQLRGEKLRGQALNYLALVKCTATNDCGHLVGAITG